MRRRAAPRSWGARSLSSAKLCCLACLLMARVAMGPNRNEIRNVPVRTAWVWQMVPRGRSLRGCLKPRGRCLVAVPVQGGAPRGQALCSRFAEQAAMSRSSGHCPDR